MKLLRLPDFARLHRILVLPATLLAAQSSLALDELYSIPDAAAGPPYTTWASTEANNGYAFRTYESFSLTSAAQVNQVSWTGVYIDENPGAAAPPAPPTTAWRIGFFTTAAGEPGTQVHSVDIPAVSVTSVFLSDEEWSNGNPLTRRRYTANLPAPVILASGVTYWFSPVSLQPAYNPHFSWWMGTGTGDCFQHQTQPPTDFTRQGNRAFTLRGGPPPPGISLSILGNTIASGGSHNIGTLAIGLEHSAAVQIHNTGGSPLTGISAAITPAGNSDFRIGIAPPTSVAAGSMATFTVVFSPQSIGTRTGTLQLTSNGDPSPYTIIFTGTGSDTTPPVINPHAAALNLVDGDPGNAAALSAWLTSRGGAVATDNSGSVTWSHDYTAPPPGPGQSRTVTFTASDASNNTATTANQLRMLDQTPPAITSPAVDLTVNCTAVDRVAVVNAWLAANGTATATDNSGSFTWGNNFTTLPAACGVQTITFTAEDPSGNKSTTSAVLTVVDSTAPVFTMNAADLVVESNGSGNATQRNAWLTSRGGAAAADSCGSVTISHNFTALANNLPQAVPVTFTATDSCGNVTTSTANFIIQDTTPPALTTPARDFYGSQDSAASSISTFLSTRSGAQAVDIAGPVTWTHNFNGTPPPVGGYTTVTFTATDTVGLSVSSTCRLFLFPPGVVWVGPASGFWSTGSNWFSSGSAPDYYVDLFSFQNTHTTMNGNYTLQNLHVGAGDRVDMAGSITLNGTINNAGIIRSRREDDTQGFSNYLVVNGQSRLQGPGRFILGGAAKNQIVPGTVAPYELTVAADHEITTSSDTYGGYQGTSIHTRLVNQGTVTADGGVLNLYSLPKVNQGTFRAINGGQLELQANVDNTGGTVLAGANSTIYHNAALTGGTVTGPGRLLINSNGNFIGPMLLESSLTTALDGGNTGMAGTITNNGLLTIGSATSTNSAYLYLNGPVTLNGSGKLLFQNLGRRQILAATNVVTDVLTIGSQQEIITDARTDSNYQSSSIHARIINEGTVTANRGQLSLYDQPKINHNLLRAINGGFLNMQANVDNTGATVLAGAGSTVYLNAALTGGTVTGPGRLLINSNGNFVGPMLLDSGLTTSLDGGNTGMAGTITNNGLLTFGSATGTISASLYLNGPVTLNGSGKLRFQNPGRRQILAATNAATDILTVGAEQEITTDALTDYNYQSSAIHAGVVNHGIISADAGKLNLYNQPKINHGTMRAINGGALVIQAHTDNTSGTLFADSGSLIYPNANITGGVITGGGTLLVNAGVNFIGPILLDNGLTTAFDAGNSGLAGTITQNGLMTLGHASDGNTSNLYINGPVSLEGTGKLVFQGGGRRQILRGSASAGDVGLTIGPDIELTTDANTGLNYQATSIHAPVVNNGTITANGGGMVIYAESKTNNGTMRAVNGGRLLFQSVTITNYNATTDTLTGGRWEVESNGPVTWIDWGNSPVVNLAAGTTFRLSGANSSFAPLASLRNIQGTLMLENGKTLATSGNMVIPGRLQYGLPAAQSTTRLNITGNADFTGGTVDIADLGMITGSYILATWTGTVTGAPVLGNRPPGMTHSLIVDTAAKQLRLEVFVIPPVDVTTFTIAPGTGPNAGQNVVTIAGTGHPNASYMLEATSDLQIWTPVSGVLTSPTGAISWQFVEPATLRRRFYRFMPQ